MSRAASFHGSFSGPLRLVETPALSLVNLLVHRVFSEFSVESIIRYGINVGQSLQCFYQRSISTRIALLTWRQS